MRIHCSILHNALLRLIAPAVLLLLPLGAGAVSPDVPENAVSRLDSIASRFSTYAAWCTPEKLYLHIDRTRYAATETIWMTGWLETAGKGARMLPGNYIYAELLDRSGTCIVRTKIKRKGAGFPGWMQLPEDIPSGDYTLRAYTMWQLNSDPAYMFSQTINVLGINDGPDSSEKESAASRGRKKASSGNEAASGQDGTSVADSVFVSFWPEGGRYFPDNKSTIAFKATDNLGRSLNISGLLEDSAGEILLPVATRHDGMGAFEFLPASGKEYTLVLESGERFPLPAASTEGATISMRQIRGSVYVNAIGFGGGEGVLFVRDLEELRPLSRIPLNGRIKPLKAPCDIFRPGINHLLLTDSSGRILAERLFFIYPDENGIPVCRLDPGNLRPGPRSLINCRLTLRTPDGKPLEGDCSVSVLRGSLKSRRQDDGCVSYMMLSSELKGRINDPRHYFDPAVSLKERKDHLDLLMMVQGWRYYDLDKIFSPESGSFKLKHVKEYTQFVHGRIQSRISRKMPKKFTFSLFIPKLKSQTILSVDKGDTFIIDSLDFEENTEFLINVGTSRIGVAYMPKWDGDSFAPEYAYWPAPGAAGVCAPEEKIPLTIDDSLVDTLSAAVVTAGADEWRQELLFGHDYSTDISNNKNRTLVEFVSMRMPLFSYDGEIMFNRRERRFDPSDLENEDGEGNGMSMGFEEENRSGAVALIVDESRQEWWGYDMMRMEDIASISISSDPDPIYGGEGGIVKITLRKGASVKDVDRDPSLLYFVPLGYQVPRYFEAPRYDRGDKGDFDKRNTIYWNPSVSVKHGSAVFSFCNTDQMDYPYAVTVEGRTSSGEYFSHCCTLDFQE